jgi:hypothetical protein
LIDERKMTAVLQLLHDLARHLQSTVTPERVARLDEENGA